jgi:tetratricopeptide (TPR) repeat protein
LHQAGKHEAALTALKLAAKIEPAPALTWAIGLALQSLGRVTEAAAAFEHVVAQEPDNAEAWFFLGVIEQDCGRLHVSIERYRKALALRPDLAEAAVNLGICQQETGDLGAAKESYRVALRLRPDCFGRIAQALCAASIGEVWTDGEALRRSLAG